MNTNQKSIAVLSSPFLFGISQVGASMAALASYPARKLSGSQAIRLASYPARSFSPAVLANAPLLKLSRDGQRSTVREDKYCRDTRAFGDSDCGAVISPSRINRASRRAADKFLRRNPTIKVA